MLSIPEFGAEAANPLTNDALIRDPHFDAGTPIPEKMLPRFAPPDFGAKTEDPVKKYT